MEGALWSLHRRQLSSKAKGTSGSGAIAPPVRHNLTSKLAWSLLSLASQGSSLHRVLVKNPFLDHAICSHWGHKTSGWMLECGYSTGASLPGKPTSTRVSGGLQALSGLVSNPLDIQSELLQGWP
jgi:hypothetical protein